MKKLILSTIMSVALLTSFSVSAQNDTKKDCCKAKTECKKECDKEKKCDKKSECTKKCDKNIECNKPCDKKGEGCDKKPKQAKANCCK